jgi:hypothetical protein
MPQIGDVTLGKPPDGWRVFLEALQTTAGNVAWSILPEVAGGMTESQADAIAASLRAFLRKLVVARKH